MDFNNLKKMYMINSCSKNENQLQLFIREQLKRMDIGYKVDKHNQTYNVSNPKQPLLSAHADQVGHKPLKRLTDKNGIISGDVNLGADDKNGIFIILELLKKFPDLNFIISNQEEIGGKIQVLLPTLDLSHIPYGLVFDRRGNGDIIGVDNNYCTSVFEADIAMIGKAYGYKPETGIYSDADHIREYLSCVNLSCGYYNAHSDTEYTVKKDVINCIDFAVGIIENITDFYANPEIIDYKNCSQLDDFYGNVGMEITICQLSEIQ
jgi:tripeptide aminopeptidase